MLEIGIVFAFLYFRHKAKLWDFSYDKLDSFILINERKFGYRQSALMLTLLLVVAACIYMRPASHCAYMGKFYAQLASAPFAFDPSNPVPHRILTSLISYALGLRGQLIIITNMLVASALIFFTFSYFRRHCPRPGDALLAAAILTFSLVTLGTVYYGGYNDSLTYLLIFSMWTCRKKRFAFYLLLFLGLMNRETIAFLVPWFVLISFEKCQNKGRKSIELAAGLGISFMLYFTFRYWLSSQVEFEYSVGFYLNKFVSDPLAWLRITYADLGLGFFSVFKTLWIIPLLAVISFCKQRNYIELLSFALLIGGASAQLLFASDISRLFTLSFMIMLISLACLFKTNNYNIRQWILIAFVFNLLIPNLTVAAGRIDIMHSLLSYAIEYGLRP